jgi:mRNA interferase HicA
MKRNKLLKILRKNGCYLKREGSSHSIWISSINGKTETVPRHVEIPDVLAKKIMKTLGITGK